MTMTLKSLIAGGDLSVRDRKERRTLLRSIVAGAGVVALALAGYVPILEGWARRLRPPGALAEREYLASCIKCGQCVQVCPVQAIRFGDAMDGFGNGVPHIDARRQACDFSCDAVQCVLACPTGALTHSLDKKEQAQMGLARLVRPDACLARKGEAFKGQARGPEFTGQHRYLEVDRWKPIAVADHPYDLALCDLCVRECPIKGAISMEPVSSDPADKRRTPVVHQACVGCGMCEMICPVAEACITVEPRLTWDQAAKGVSA